MFGFKASFAAAFSGIANIFSRAFGMALFTETICEIKRIKPMGGKKAKGYNAKTKYRAAQIMVVNERDIFDLSAQFGQNGIIDHKISLLLRDFFQFDGLKNLIIGFIHKRSPAIACVVFISVKRILLSP